MGKQTKEYFKSFFDLRKFLCFSTITTVVLFLHSIDNKYFDALRRNSWPKKE
jgi:hypothetical protein